MKNHIYFLAMLSTIQAFATSEVCQEFMNSRSQYQTVSKHIQNNGLAYLSGAGSLSTVGSMLGEASISSRYSNIIHYGKENVTIKERLLQLEKDLSFSKERAVWIEKHRKLELLNANHPDLARYEKKIIEHDKNALRYLKQRLTNPEQVQEMTSTLKTIGTDPEYWMTRSGVEMKKYEHLLNAEAAAVQADLKQFRIYRGLRYLGEGLVFGVGVEVAYSLICPDKVGNDTMEKSEENFIKYPNALYGLKDDATACRYLDQFPALAESFRKYRDGQEDIHAYIESIDPMIKEANEKSGIPAKFIKGNTPVYDFSQK